MPNRLFYDNDLVCCAARAITDRFLTWSRLPNSQVPLIFHGVIGEDKRENSSPSWLVYSALCALIGNSLPLISQVQ